MSAETLHAVDDAIRAHVADEYPSNIVTSYFTIGSRIDPTEDDRYSRYFQIKPEGAEFHVQVGLLQVALHDKLHQVVTDDD